MTSPRDDRLRAAIVRKETTQKEVAKKLNISPRTFSMKMKKGVFDSDEIEKMMAILDIKDPVPVFLANCNKP